MGKNEGERYKEKRKEIVTRHVDLFVYYITYYIMLQHMVNMLHHSITTHVHGYIKSKQKLFKTIILEH